MKRNYQLISLILFMFCCSGCQEEFEAVNDATIVLDFNNSAYNKCSTFVEYTYTSENFANRDWGYTSVPQSYSFHIPFCGEEIEFKTSCENLTPAFVDVNTTQYIQCDKSNIIFMN